METQQSGQSFQHLQRPTRQKQPLLSICIPTYNRAEYLEQCLEAIVHQEGFDERVEIVISDNASTDGTRELVQKYQKKYNNIVYNKNSENVQDENFPIVLNLATGVLRKLTNDTIIYKNGAIEYMLDVARKNLIKKPQVYFLNSGKNREPIKIDNLEQYITTLNYNLTWIGSFAIWDEDSNDLKTFMLNVSSHLGQIPYLLEHFERHNGAVIYDQRIMSSISLKKKNLTYGLYQVFYVNFLDFIKRYIDAGKISNSCYEHVKKSLLLDFFAIWIVNFEKYPDKYLISDENLKKLVENEYKEAPYYWKYKIKLMYYRFKSILRIFTSHIEKYLGILQEVKNISMLITNKIKNKIKTLLRKSKILSFLIDYYHASKNVTYRNMITDLANGSGQIFYFQKFGELNPDKYIYLTGFSEGGVTLGGICAILKKDLIELELIEKFNLTPVIEYRESVLTEKIPINGTYNAFEYYYDPISDISVDEAWKSRNVCLQRNANVLKRDIPFGYNYTEEQIDRLARIYAKYFHLNDITQKNINRDMSKLIKGKNTLGINIRGTDFNAGFEGHPVAIQPVQLIPIIDKRIKSDNFEQLFIATDDQGYLDAFINVYGDKLLFYRDVHREYGNRSTAVVDYLAQEDGMKYRGGYECLRDFYTLASCNSIVAGFSGVEVMARIVKRAKDERFDNCDIISNGYYRTGKIATHCYRLSQSNKNKK